MLILQKQSDDHLMTLQQYKEVKQINIFYNFSNKMSATGSPIRGLQPNVKQFTLQNYALNTENDRLTQLLISKNNQIQSLVQNNAKLKSTYEAQASAYRKTIQSLEKQLNQSEQSRDEEFNEIKDKYNRLTKQEMENLKSTHTNEIQFLFKEIAQLRASIQTYNSKLQVKHHQNLTLKASYERQLSMNTSQINNLSKKIIQLQEDKLRQIKDLTNRRELEKSRTTGIVSSRKESTLYIEKQLRKLNEDVLEKTIAIENMNRELLKQRKKNDQIEKSSKNKIEILIKEYQHQLRQKEEQFAKIQKILKEEIVDYKTKEIKLMSENENLKSTANLQKKELQAKQSIIVSKNEQITNLKSTIQKTREQHINEINNLMKQRRKRSSKSNLGSSRSLTSSLRESAIITPPANQGNSTPIPSMQNQAFINKFPSFLPTVKEENSPQRKDLSQQLSHSNILQDENENELARAIYHYDSIIQQLKRSHEMEIQYMKLSLEKNVGKLKEKELQLQDVLTRFSPLVKIHADQKSLQQDRKERIERHWKADLSILQIMLKRYKIRTF